MPRSDFDTPSGFADDFDFYVDSARFATSLSYMDGQIPLLIWEGHSPDAEDVTEVMYPIGTGWTIRNRGASVEHEKGRKTFIRNSIMGHLIRRVVDELNVESRYPGFFEGSPRDASIWVGFGFHLKREKISYPNLRRDERTTGVETERLMPVAILAVPGEKRPAGAGVTGASATTTGAAANGRPSAATAAAAASTTTPATAPATATASNAVAVVRKKLEILARSKTREEFQLAAMDLPEVQADAELLNEVLNDGDDGFWARHRAAAPA